MLNNYLCDFLSQEILKDAKKLLTRDELVVLHFIISLIPQHYYKIFFLST